MLCVFYKQKQATKWNEKEIVENCANSLRKTNIWPIGVQETLSWERKDILSAWHSHFMVMLFYVVVQHRSRENPKCHRFLYSLAWARRRGMEKGQQTNSRWLFHLTEHFSHMCLVISWAINKEIRRKHINKFRYFVWPQLCCVHLSLWVPFIFLQLKLSHDLKWSKKKCIWPLKALLIDKVGCKTYHFSMKKKDLCLLSQSTLQMDNLQFEQLKRLIQLQEDPVHAQHCV